MIEVSDLEQMAEKLRVYDVVQDGWEGDPEGSSPKSVEDNLRHVGEHLAGVVAFKNFGLSEVTDNEIVPDCLQYGLRMARWVSVEPNELVGQEYPYAAETMGIASRLQIGSGDHGELLAGVILANGILMGRQMHDEDHERLHDNALRERANSVRTASGILIRAAWEQEVWARGRFSLTEVFDDRLASLRERFGIPEPVTE